MASGKQLSFQYGEVSPSLRFRSDAVSYASGLSKLTNMYVRRAGGVSNRQGLEFVKLAASQSYIPAEGAPMGIKAFTYWSTILKQWVTAEFARDVTEFPMGPVSAIGVAYDTIDPTSFYNVQAEQTNAPEISEIKFTPHKDGIFISPGFNRSEEAVESNVNLEYGVLDTTIGSGFPNGATGGFVIPVLSTLHGTYGEPPYLDVSYLVTVTYKNGQEEAIYQAKSPGAAANGATPMSIAHPHADLQYKLEMVLDESYSSTIKKLNLYRASGNAGFGSSIYSLVGSQLYLPASYAEVVGDTDPSFIIAGLPPGPVYNVKDRIVNVDNTAAAAVLVGMKVRSAYWPAGTTVLSKIVAATTTIVLSGNHNIPNSELPKTGFSTFFYSNATIFSDYGQSNPSLTPPIDSGMMIENSKPISVDNPDLVPTLGGVRAAAYYQQRLICAMEAGTTEDIKSGTVLVSKIGAPRQIKSPQIFSDSEAFSFNIPITDGTPCHALLAMERLMAFTERGVYIIRGGEQGILTPTAVNPLLVSEEGCSKVVEPKMSGRKGYFVNASHTKLMAIEFGVDGNVSVFEASVFSDHTLDKDIVQLEVLGGGEDTVYLLRRDGKLVRVTAADEGSHGFAVMETNGYIESIYRGKALRPYAPNSVDLANSEKYYDVLMCYVIRNGYRTLERLNFREDKYREGEFFADCYESFGMRLSEFGNEGYVKIGAPDSNNPRINIQGSGPWTAGTPITIWSTHADIYQPTLDNGGVMHFFYEDTEGKVQFLRYIINPSTLFATGDLDFPQGYTGYFEADVPASLQDVNSQSLSLEEKKRRQTRWAPAFNIVSDLNGVKYAAFEDPTSLVAEQVAVSVSGDGEVLSSPNNPYAPTLYLDKDALGEVTLTLPDYYTFGYVGMPYTSEFETLDLEAGGEKTLTDAKKLLNAVGVGFNESRGGFFGMPNQDLTNMEEIQPREDESFNNQSGNTSGHLVINTPAEWNEAGRVNIKQVDPAPITILSVYPKGISGD